MTVPLAFEPKSRQVMQQPPHPNEALPGSRIKRILVLCLTGFQDFGVFYIHLHGDVNQPAQWRSIL